MQLCQMVKKTIHLIKITKQKMVIILIILKLYLLKNINQNQSFNLAPNFIKDKVQQAKQEIIPKSNLSENSSETLPIEKRRKNAY